MITSRLLPLAALALLADCAGRETEAAHPSASTPAARATYQPPTGRGRRVGEATVLNTVQARHVFSSAVPDQFVLQLRGPRILSGRLYLAVLSAGGDTLSRQVVPARVLLDPQALTTRDQEISVLRGMNNFFNANRFVQPAVAASTPPPPSTSFADWMALRADPQAVGFAYPAASGTLRRLVYVPRLGRALVLGG